MGCRKRAGVCAANREIPPMLNQLQHRLNCLIISVMTEQIRDSLAFTMFFRHMPRDLLSSCLYVSMLQTTAEISFSCGNTGLKFEGLYIW